MKKKPTKKTPVNPDAVPAWAKGPYRGMGYHHGLGVIAGQKQLLARLSNIALENGKAGRVWLALFGEMFSKLEKQQEAMK